MHHLLSLVPQSSQLDLRRIAGYLSWLAWAMNWPTFMATHILQRETFWLQWADRHSLLSKPRTLGIQARSLLDYVDATPSSFGVYVQSTPPQTIYQPFTDEIPIAVAELAAALFTLVWCGSRLRQPTVITLATDSSVVYYVLTTGKVYTIRNNVWLQALYVRRFKIKLDRGHGLVVRWEPSQANLADPVSNNKPVGYKGRCTLGTGVSRGCARGSAPWDTISDDASSIASSSDASPQRSEDEQESVQDSIWVNLLSRTRDRPTHYVPTDVRPVPPNSPLAQSTDQWIRDLIIKGASLPPPLHAPRYFQHTPTSPLMDQVIQHLKQQGILQSQPVVAAYTCFLVPKADRSARFVIDLNPLTTLYKVPKITLYSTARVITIHPFDQMIKLDIFGLLPDSVGAPAQNILRRLLEANSH
jgi:hypothetical protein